MNLPQAGDLPVAKLAASFGNTSATYKFYWLIAIIEAVENGSTTIKKRTLFSSMIANSWYTVNYFKVSFGKQDLIQQAVETILRTEKLTIDLRKDVLCEVLKNSDNAVTK